MQIIKPIVHETIWGGNRLTPYSNTDKQKIGHLYSLVSNGEFESEILNGKYKGQLFKKYFDENKEKWGLAKFSEFPYIVALVDATDDLSIQVHPNDDIAKELEGTKFGKNESWYFIEPPKSGKLYNGCKASNSQELREKVLQNRYDDVIDYLVVEKGDYVYVEAGTMHAMSAGSLVFEIEENCNATYRVYDFDRIDKNGNKRQLHTEYALKAIDVYKKSVTQKYTEKKAERFYSTELFKNNTEYTNKLDTIVCLTILNGVSVIDDIKIQTGVSIVLEPNETITLNNSDFIVSQPIAMEER